jgi:Ca-activated chloride channel family protein
MLKRLLSLTAIAVFLAPALVPSQALGQGMLIDARDDVAFRLPRPMPIDPPIRWQPPRTNSTYKIKELEINANLSDQVAKVQVSQTFVNTGSNQMEVSFIFPLPYDGAVDKLTFMVEGKEYEAKLLDAKEARDIYESYMRRNIDPALLEWMGHGMFKTSVFPVPAGASRKVTMKYSQLCKKQGGITDFIVPLSTAKYTSKPVERVAVNVNIQSQAAIKNVYSPSNEISVERPSNIQAVVKYEAKDEVPSGDFRLMYDVGEEAVGTSVLSYRPESGEEGYFLMLVSPDIDKANESTPPKTVVFVVDRSGSMSGKKIEQARGALKTVLNKLNEGDLFNVIAYDSEVESFKPELQRYSDETRKQALGFVEGIYAGGSTNIDGALSVALGQLQDKDQPSYIVFLTDGLPTQGETKETQIVANAKEKNEVRARIFSMGVGYDVNSRLLDKLARYGFGQSEYVRPNEDIETAVAKLYNRVGAPAMTDLDFNVDVKGLAVEDGKAVSRVYPKEIYDLFAGDQLAIVGRYKKPGMAKVVVKGTVEGEEEKIDFPANFVEKSNDETYAFIAKLWAVRRVGEIIDDIDLNGKNDELVAELVTLAKKHGIITPYTSFLAEEPMAGFGDDGIRPAELAMRNEARAAKELEALDEVAGEAGFAQRDFKNDLQKAAAAPAAGNARYRAADSDREVVVNSVQNVGAKTFFLRNDTWTDSDATPEQIKNVKKIERFSDSYFDLVSKHGKDNAKYLAIEGNVLVVFEGQAYQF